MHPPEPHGLSGTFLVGFGKPSPKRDSSQEGSYFEWSTQCSQGASTNTSDEISRRAATRQACRAQNRKSQLDL